MKWITNNIGQKVKTSCSVKVFHPKTTKIIIEWVRFISCYGKKEYYCWIVGLFSKEVFERKAEQNEAKTESGKEATVCLSH